MLAWTSAWEKPRNDRASLGGKRAHAQCLVGMHTPPHTLSMFGSSPPVCVPSRTCLTPAADPGSGGSQSTVRLGHDRRGRSIKMS